MAATYSGEARPSPEPSDGVSPASPASSTGEIPMDQPPKLKGRHRLLQNLQRMSSTPALTRRARSATTGSTDYPRGGKASLSCVSLASPSYTPCFGNGNASPLYGGLNARPATPGTPGSPPEHTPTARIRMLDAGRSLTPQPRSVGLPIDMRPSSRGTPSREGKLGEGFPQPDSLPVSIPDSHKARPTESKVGEDVVSPPTPEKTFDFWGNMPAELKMNILGYLTPKEIIRCSAVSKAWNQMCYDGQLWSHVDTTDYYRDIPSDSLLKIITSGGPFVRDLNLRGCIQLRDKWMMEGEKISDSCRNVINFSLEGTRIDKSSVHFFLLRNPRLEYINLTGLSSVTNSAMKIIAQSCPYLGILNVSWCSNVDTKGLKKIVQSCHRLRDLRASEIRGFDDGDFALKLFERNTLERLIMGRTDLTDQSLKYLIQGENPHIDLLTDRPVVPPRRFRHLDLHQCTEVTDEGLKTLAHNVPDLEGLRLSQCSELTDDSIIDVIRTTPKLSHFEVEDVERVTNNLLIELAKCPCAAHLEHLNISYCESLGDVGMLQVMKSCPNIRSVEMDNTRVSDLTLMEASSRARKRGYGEKLPQVGLRLVVFDCANITWAGVKEVLSSNCYTPRPRKSSATMVTVTQTTSDSGVSGMSTPTIPSTPVSPTSSPPPLPEVYPNHIVQLKCFYGWQMTVDHHTKRVLRGDLAAASRLDRKWADYMMATEEAGAAGAGARRRRRRAREAERLYNVDSEEEDEYAIGGISSFGGRRRRAQSGGCVVM
ncbi:F-box domain protein [Aspergillus sclerotialis]|uniref:F-box domain protein n=1 Tax=Aspergillus sclerotialis TaxID=2070753 RepID=A0A3A2ZNA0_9EURO|nr:F-box domain protein [Aspergillus sclerotialis]